MAYSLQDLASECRAVLKADSGPSGRERVRALLQDALRDKEFVAAQFAGAAADREVIYEDTELGFCICRHVYRTARGGHPHDHGPTWAIYGQAEGETEMTDWTVIAKAADGKPARVRQERTYTLRPGDVHLYQPGAVHSPRREGPTKLIRIEGTNTEHVARTPIEAVA